MKSRFTTIDIKAALAEINKRYYIVTLTKTG